MMRVNLNVDSDIEAGLKKLAADVKAEAIRPAARAGALVFYEEMRRNVPVKDGTLRDAIYHAFGDTESTDDLKVYKVSVNKGKAGHWHLIEYGRLQRYVSYQTNSGEVRLAVRPGMEGRPPPKRRASQAEKDSYYIPLPGGPRLVPAKPYIRPAWDKGQAAAMEAMRRRLREKMAEVLQGRTGGVDVD